MDRLGSFFNWNLIPDFKNFNRGPHPLTLLFQMSQSCIENQGRDIRRIVIILNTTTSKKIIIFTFPLFFLYILLYVINDDE